MTADPVGIPEIAPEGAAMTTTQTRAREHARQSMWQADAHAAMAKAIRGLAATDPKMAAYYEDEARKQDALFDEFFEDAVDQALEAGFDVNGCEACGWPAFLCECLGD